MKRFLTTLAITLIAVAAALYPQLMPLRAIANSRSEITPESYAIKKLKDVGISEKMITLFQEVYSPEERDRIIELNVLGFFGKTDYSGHFGGQAIKECVKFIKKYGRKLSRIEASYGVPREIIAALLWVETKHGTRTGKHNVPNVYFSLIQSDHPEVIRATLAALSSRAPDQVAEYKQKVIDRSHAKANWALGELKSLDEIQKARAKDIRTLSGSYAGAFGIPQFIPSSYLQWARPRLKTRQPNLFEMEDAIHSVGFYLKANGWKPSDPSSHRDALFHYNRSEGYVDVILKLAASVRTEAIRSSRKNEVKREGQ